MREWIVPTIGTLVLWGLWSFMPRLITQYLEPKSAIIYQALGSVVTTAVILCLLRFRLETHPRGIVLALVTGIVGCLGSVTYLVAMSKSQVSAVVGITALYPALSVLLAVIVLKEPLTFRQGADIVLALIAMVLIAV